MHYDNEKCRLVGVGTPEVFDGHTNNMCVDREVFLPYGPCLKGWLAMNGAGGAEP